MPILNFHCNSCGKTFAKIFFDLDGVPKSCPACGAPGPRELGQAFEYDESRARRALCTSCDECGSEPCATIASR